ncbi:MAG: NAD-dependent epimerase/dehydratase family protein [Anaerolineae bacterium]|jgi:nucleoside-diphosphate-sugar epimerase|nr:NAD-dependent epimerase/dehydratase family protein [Anaerolineae bacterium]
MSMSRQRVVLITGANGEVGHGLIHTLRQRPDCPGIVVLDLRSLDPEMMPYVDSSIVGDILNEELLDNLSSEYEIEAIYHLAALLSTHSEFRPEVAHRVNVRGTLNLLTMALEQAQFRGEPVKFIFPSSVAVFGMPDLSVKASVAPVKEDEHLNPITMYGVNKLYCEHLGRYYTHHYRQLAANRTPSGVDFRGVRFPGLISATTVPSGGTSDYAPEMIHAAAKYEPYACFVRPDTTMPFMAMPDGIRALIELARAPREALTRSVYNLTSFSLSAEQVAARVKTAFPGAEITYEPSAGRQNIVDSWPADMDDSAARADWGWQPEYDADKAFNEYLVPTIRAKYRRREA